MKIRKSEQVSIRKMADSVGQYGHNCDEANCSGCVENSSEKKKIIPSTLRANCQLNNDTNYLMLLLPLSYKHFSMLRRATDDTSKCVDKRGEERKAHKNTPLLF